ncbi:hypothetical protein [Maribacter hydrothermalis]|uniref:Mechanosensitive ion channel n=1 Tax=Maribacter hydrothermalis TaxID=1836467 RepID=A0A1B7ZF41_9FLAO|nr:hypothetical protein [Maribacter hydrothermalis]APQ17686.1 hypothetical protein BTR34_10255 [Maribacter hydrothermalis]OBR42161.1 hypothetical protein A9200_01880 [Maribacter hydrothermalis]
METIESFNTWEGLFYLTTGLFLLYWLIKILQLAAERFPRKSLFTKKGIDILKSVLLVFKPVAFLLIILDFIAINYIVHGLFLTLIGVLAYMQIRNYISGLLLNMNPLVTKGATITIANLKGEIKQLLPQGMVISTESGQSFVEYGSIDKTGFSITSKDTGIYRHTLTISAELSKEQLLDFLFANPILNFQEPPTVRESEILNTFKLQYTLEEGGNDEDFLAFLAEHKIKTTLTQNSEV